jgi:hypothetical protein
MSTVEFFGGPMDGTKVLDNYGVSYRIGIPPNTTVATMPKPGPVPAPDMRCHVYERTAKGMIYKGETT